MSKAGQLPGRRFREPAFAHASVCFCEGVCADLIAAADRARPAWARLRDKYPDQFELVSTVSENAIPDYATLSVAHEFTHTWIEGLAWKQKRMFRDAVLFDTPPELLGPLTGASTISSVELVLGMIRDFCCAQLRSDDSHTHYQLAINTPVWIALGSDDRFRNSFNQQLRLVVHHEGAHFRWRGDKRGEWIAHARGIGAVLDGDCDWRDRDLPEKLQSHCPEVWQNPEIQQLVLETRGGPRLVRAWSARSSRISPALPVGALRGVPARMGSARLRLARGDYAERWDMPNLSANLTLQRLE